jgi:methyl-accepting chemotaxis protein
MANKAANDAVEGGRAVEQTVEAMKQIAKRINIIDDIAYQTNLSRSTRPSRRRARASTARDSRWWRPRCASSPSAARWRRRRSARWRAAQRGGRREGRQAPRRDGAAIKKTSDLVQEIAAASREQSSSVDQIELRHGAAEPATQQNASSSEELAATAEEMSAQAQQLQGLMAFFKLETRARPPAERARSRGEGLPRVRRRR